MLFRSAANGLALAQACYDGPVATLGRGVCRAGIQACAGGAYGDCQRQVLPAIEICDGLDNDCDGLVDEGDNGLPLTLLCFDGDPVTQNNPPCQFGEQYCQNGVYGPCLDQIAPAVDICDGVDNDCDGVVDNQIGRAHV